MKKIVTLLIALALSALIYYFTVGSSQLTEALKQEVNHELTTLTDHGFTVEDRSIDSQTEHCVLTVQEPEKIHQYLLTQNAQINLEDVQLLQDQKIGVDIEYLPSSSDAIALELYPVNLPRTIYEHSKPDDQKAIEVLEKMVNEKLFVAHINVNTLGTGFDGYIQDIDHAFELDGNRSHIIMKDWTFKGDLDNQTVTRVSQNLQQFHYGLNDTVTLQLNNMQATIDTANEDNQTVQYTLESLSLQSDLNETFEVTINGIQGVSEDKINGDLLSNQSKFDVNFVEFQNKEGYQKFDHVTVDTAVRNLNMKALTQFQNFADTPQDENRSFEQMLPLLKALTGADTAIDINRIAITSITENNVTYNGFDMSLHAEVDKDFNWDQVDENPILISTLFDLKANLILSDKIAEMLAQNPKALMFMMFTQPKEHNGNKIYDIEYTQGSLKINGAPLL